MKQPEPGGQTPGPGPPPGPPPSPWWKRNWLAVLVALAALLVGAGIGAAAGGNQTKTVTSTQTVASVQTKTVPQIQTRTVTKTVPAATKTVTQVVTHTVTVPSGGTGGGGGGAQRFSGVDTQNLGTINVSTDSTLRWSCPGCSNSNFMVLNDPSDADTIAVNSLNQTSGQTVVTAGKYTKVTVIGSGPWSFTITPGT